MRQIVANSIIPFLVVLLAAVSACAAGPTITSLSTSSTFVGYAVTITGTNFGSSKGSSTVAFNGTQATSVTWGSSGTSIVAHVPAAATSGNVAGGPPLRFL